VNHVGFNTVHRTIQKTRVEDGWDFDSRQTLNRRCISTLLFDLAAARMTASTAVETNTTKYVQLVFRINSVLKCFWKHG
jgi:hypothetical protein